jgi:hypothetical protein
MRDGPFIEAGDIRGFRYRTGGVIVEESGRVISTDKETSGLQVIEVQFPNGRIRKYSRQHLPNE